MSTTPRRAWGGLAALLLPVFLVSMDASVLYLAMPHVTAALHPSSEQQLWILDIYPFMLAGLLITMGNLGDRWGRRRLMTWAPHCSAWPRCSRRSPPPRACSSPLAR